MVDRIPKRVLDHLATVPLFSECNKDELRAVARLGTSLDVGDGEILIRQGKPGSEFFLLIDGRVSCLVDERPVATLTSGDFFGEMALIDNGPRHATVLADGPTRLVVFDAREFSRLLDASPSIARKLLKAFAVRWRSVASVRD
jgi:CRP/FNR family transcriptional regulator, cyclic AMP receptor protein